MPALDTGVLIHRDMAKHVLFFPARFGAPGRPALSHANGATPLFPAAIKAEEEGDPREVESILHEPLDEPHPLQVVIGEETLCASSFRFDQP
jgi:hypothetical protein